jgi:predicted O-linked N-acetylglucosamine transferase (SPINDLY family)
MVTSFSPGERELAVRQWLALAMQAHQRGPLAKAEALYLQILQAQPGHFEAQHLLGVLRAQQGRYGEALELVGAALRTKPDSAGALTNYGLILHRMKRHAEALVSYEKALAIRPNHAEALNNRGNALAAVERYPQALASYDQAIAVKPDYAEALNNRGNVLSTLDRHHEALASYDRALTLRPDYAEALCGRAHVFVKLETYEQALASYDRALAIRPDDADAHYDRGNVLAKLKRYADALKSYDKALAIAPHHAEALENRGNALAMLKRHEEALACYDAAMALDPSSVRTLVSRGTALKELKRYDLALASYDAALTRSPGYVEALYGRGNALKEIKRYDEALDNYDRARALKPDHPDAFGWVDAALATCDWGRTAGLAGVVAGELGAGRPIIAPFTLLGICEDPALQLQCAKNYLDERIPVRPAPLWRPKPLRNGAGRGDGRLRVAYLSADLQNHATAYLTAELFELHDRSRFEIVAISFGRDDGSDMRRRLMKAFDQFHDVQAGSDRDVAGLIRDLGIDIAVDLKGFTRDARPEILSFRPAPIQVNFLGFPATMGADFIDYIIADRIVLPFDQHPFYTERIAHLPDCYQPNDTKRAIAERTGTRAEEKLPDDGLVFCCFNNNYKITPQVFGVWMRLLAAVPGSVLWLLRDNDGAQANLRREAQAQGVAPARLVFAERVTLDAHLARLRLADLFLDTLPYNAHTTASDALWAGVPVLTCKGETFAGRVAASLLQAVGLPELVTQGLADYEAAALRLATDAALLGDARRKLAQNRQTHPLFDADRFRLHIESAYTKMWDIRQQSDGAPQSFSIEAEDAPGLHRA